MYNRVQSCTIVYNVPASGPSAPPWPWQGGLCRALARGTEEFFPGRACQRYNHQPPKLFLIVNLCHLGSTYCSFAKTWELIQGPGSIKSYTNFGNQPVASSKLVVS